MKNEKEFFLAVFLIVFLISIFVGFKIWSTVLDKIWGDPYAAERKKLASELGVNLSDYPQLGFPTNYFSDVLITGMSSEEVHKIVIGYKEVFLCDGDSEFYFYLSADENKALRFLIVYDVNGKLKYTIGEDPNERYLQNDVDECTPGLFGVE